MRRGGAKLLGDEKVENVLYAPFENESVTYILLKYFKNRHSKFTHVHDLDQGGHGQSELIAEARLIPDVSRA